MAKTPNIKKKIALGVFAAMLAVGLGAATNEAVNVDEICFELQKGIDNPSVEVASDPNSYILPVNSCPGLVETLCKICFDQDRFPLNAQGKPDFANHPELEALVINNMNTISPVPVTYTDTFGNWVTLTFRAEN